MSSDDVVRSVSKRLKYYIDVQRREEGFDLSGPELPRLDYPPLKQGPVIHGDGRLDRSLKHYFSYPSAEKSYDKVKLRDIGYSRTVITQLRQPSPEKSNKKKSVKNEDKNTEKEYENQFFEDDDNILSDNDMPRRRNSNPVGDSEKMEKRTRPRRTRSPYAERLTPRASKSPRRSRYEEAENVETAKSKERKAQKGSPAQKDEQRSAEEKEEDARRRAEIRRSMRHYMRLYEYGKPKLIDVSCLFRLTRYNPKRALAQESFRRQQMTQAKPMRGGYPVLHTVPPSHVSRSEKRRLMNNASKLIAVTEQVSVERKKGGEKNVKGQGETDHLVTGPHSQPASLQSSQGHCSSVRGGGSQGGGSSRGESESTRRKTRNNERTSSNQRQDLDPQRQKQKNRDVEDIPYTITLYTGILSSETDEAASPRSSKSKIANVHLVMVGDKGSSPPVNLSDSLTHSVKFTDSQVDMFEIHSPYVGRIKRIDIGHDCEDDDVDWFVDKVVIRDETRDKMEYTIPCHRRLTRKDELDNRGKTDNPEVLCASTKGGQKVVEIDIKISSGSPKSSRKSSTAGGKKRERQDSSDNKSSSSSSHSRSPSASSRSSTPTDHTSHSSHHSPQPSVRPIPRSNHDSQSDHSHQTHSSPASSRSSSHTASSAPSHHTPLASSSTSPSRRKRDDFFDQAPKGHMYSEEVIANLVTSPRHTSDSMGGGVHYDQEPDYEISHLNGYVREEGMNSGGGNGREFRRSRSTFDERMDREKYRQEQIRLNEDAERSRADDSKQNDGAGVQDEDNGDAQDLKSDRKVNDEVAKSNEKNYIVDVAENAADKDDEDDEEDDDADDSSEDASSSSSAFSANKAVVVQPPVSGADASALTTENKQLQVPLSMYGNYESDSSKSTTANAKKASREETNDEQNERRKELKKSGENELEKDGYGRSILESAICGDLDRIKELASINSVDIMKERDEKGCSVLHLAAANNQQSTVQWLSSKLTVSDIDAKSQSGKTALQLALMNGNIECAKELYLNGAKIDLKNLKGQNALHLAAKKGQLESVKWLVSKGASFTESDHEGLQPLDIADKYDQTAVVRELVQFYPAGQKEIRLGRNTNF